MVNKFIRRFYTFLIFGFLYAPIAVLTVFSFNDSKSTAKWEGFTLDWYQSLFNNSYIMKSLYYTVLVALIASVVATIIGTFAAFGLFYMKSWKQKAILNVNSIPILNPDIVTGVSLMTLFVALNVNLGLLTMIIAHVTFCIPYVVLSVLPKLKQMPGDRKSVV